MEQFAPSPQRMYWKLCDAGTTSISFSSFLPVEVSGRIAIALTGDVAGRAGDLGRARERGHELLRRPSSCDSAWRSGPRSGAPGPSRSRSAATPTTSAAGAGSGFIMTTTNAPTPIPASERERDVDQGKACAVRRAAGAVGAGLPLVSPIGWAGSASMNAGSPRPRLPGRSRRSRRRRSVRGGGGCRSGCGPRPIAAENSSGGQTDSSARSSSGIMISLCVQQAAGARRP